MTQHQLGAPGRGAAGSSDSEAIAPGRLAARANSQGQPVNGSVLQLPPFCRRIVQQRLQLTSVRPFASIGVQIGVQNRPVLADHCRTKPNGSGGKSYRVRGFTNERKSSRISADEQTQSCQGWGRGFESLRPLQSSYRLSVPRTVEIWSPLSERSGDNQPHRTLQSPDAITESERLHFASRPSVPISPPRPRCVAPPHRCSKGRT